MIDNGFDFLYNGNIKHKKIDMDNVTAIIMIGILIGAGFLWGFSVGNEAPLYRKAGIEKFVQCNNAYSNWVEIVWIKK